MLYNFKQTYLSEKKNNKKVRQFVLFKNYISIDFTNLGKIFQFKVTVSNKKYW